jgi:hypothetical protein
VEAETGVDDGIFPTYAETPAASATALMRVKDFMLEDGILIGKSGG